MNPARVKESSEKIHVPKPILKWVGGKRQIKDILLDEFPVELNHYHEVFLGGGSILFSVLSYVKSGKIRIHGNIYAYDYNEPLVYVYKNIQSHHEELYSTLESILLEFNSCGNGDMNRKPKHIEEAMVSKENYYYWIRDKYNTLSSAEKNNVFGSALFIFLNKTCFRGLFRIGPNGFNVPYGHYKHPEIINKTHLDEIHQLIQPVHFECSDFKSSFLQVGPKDFIYCDPPYAPEKPTSFVGYTDKGFTLEQHICLFQWIDQFTDVKIMLSNADVSLVREHFTDKKYKIISILCRRSIHSKHPETKAKEVIITNY